MKSTAPDIIDLFVPSSHYRDSGSNGVTPRILDQSVHIQDYLQLVRQIAVRGLGHDQPTLLLTNQLSSPRASRSTTIPVAC